MFEWTTLPLWLGLAWAIAGAGLDLRFRRIPNWLTYSGILTGLVSQAVLFGAKGLALSLAGGLFAGGIFLAFFVIRAMGGGDVKLMAALGTFVGWPDVLQVLIATAFAGGFLALVLMVWHRRVAATLRNVGSVLVHHATTGMEKHPTVNLENPTALRLPYGLAIASGMAYWCAKLL